MWPSLWLSVVLGRVKMRFREEFIAFIRFKTVLVKGRHLFGYFDKVRAQLTCDFLTVKIQILSKYFNQQYKAGCWVHDPGIWVFVPKHAFCPYCSKDML